MAYAEQTHHRLAMNKREQQVLHFNSTIYSTFQYPGVHLDTISPTNQYLGTQLETISPTHSHEKHI